MLRVLISGGGTGGHIFPALSIANAIKRRHPQAEILFVGALGRMEMEKVPAAGYKIEGLPVAGFDRKHLWRNFAVLIKLFKSLRKAKKIVKEFKPDIAIGVGGYASGPTLKAAQRAGVPTLLQEQNSYPGVTNKMLAKRAKAICVAYDNLERFFPADKIILTGNPVRADLAACALTPAEARAKLGFDPDKPLLLVVGGSLGARTINDSIAAALDRISRAGVQLLWQTGKVQAQACQAAAEGHPGIVATPFIADMATAYRAASLVVARAGAGTISELENLAKPAILVPSPNVSEDHQTHNARALESQGAAVMVKDADAQDSLAETALSLLAAPQKLQRLSERIATMAHARADEKIADIIEQVINESK